MWFAHFACGRHADGVSAPLAGEELTAGFSTDALSRFVRPIGIAGIERKESAVITAAVAGQVLIARGLR